MATNQLPTNSTPRTISWKVIPIIVAGLIVIFFIVSFLVKNAQSENATIIIERSADSPEEVQMIANAEKLDCPNSDALRAERKKYKDFWIEGGECANGEALAKAQSDAKKYARRQSADSPFGSVVTYKAMVGGGFAPNFSWDYREAGAAPTTYWSPQIQPFSEAECRQLAGDAGFVVAQHLHYGAGGSGTDSYRFVHFNSQRQIVCQAILGGSFSIS